MRAAASRRTVTGTQLGADHRGIPDQAQKAREEHDRLPCRDPRAAVRAGGRLVSLLGPSRRITDPKCHGIENIPDEGSLLVGNHSTYALLDAPLLVAEVWKRRRIVVRGLGELAHYAVPVWRDALGAGGMVRGTRDNVRALMRDRQTILVFPGGGREVYKRRGSCGQVPRPLRDAVTQVIKVPVQSRPRSAAGLAPGRVPRGLPVEPEP